jgi:hypothetical protein
VFIYSSHGKWVFPTLLWSFPSTATFTSFPAPDCWCVLLLLPSPAGLFIYSSCGKWVFPSLLWSFPLTATFTSFPAPGCWACATAPDFSSWLVYLQFREGLPLPTSLVLRVSRPLCYVSFLLLLLIIQFFFLFSMDGGQSVQRAMLVCPRAVCGSTACCLAHLVVCIFPSHLGAAVWWPWGPPVFSI